MQRYEKAYQNNAGAKLLAPSVADSHRFSEIECSDSKLVLSSAPSVKRSILYVLLSPFLFIPLGFAIAWLDSGDYDETVSFLLFVLPITLAFPPVCIILIILVQPFCVVEVDTDRDELAISYHRILYGEYQRKRHVFSEVVTIEMYEYKKYSTTNGVLELLAIIIRFPRDMSVFQSINSVEQTKKHFAWLKQMAERLD